MKAKIKELSIGLDGVQTLSLRVSGDFRGEYERLKEKDLAVEIKPYRARRSLDANAYAWVLIGKIADALTADGTAHTKDEVYLELLKKYGQGGVVKVRNRDKDSILRGIKYWEEHEKLFEENAAYYRIWIGSSSYDTKEMSLFLRGIAEDCKELGIETATPEELARYEQEWHKSKYDI